MKKTKEISEKDLYFVLKLMNYAREGNVHYYEILGIPFVKHATNYDEKKLGWIVYYMAQGNLVSEAVVKTISAVLKPKLLAQASAIQGSNSIAPPSAVGLVGNSELENFDIDIAKYSLFPELKNKKKEKVSKLTVHELFEETKHSFFKFDEFLNLS